MSVQELAIALIDSGANVRDRTDTDRDFVESIRRHGVLQAITVRRVGKRYQVVMGHRRLKAARLAGLERIPAVIESEQHDDQILRQVAENVHRRAMRPLDVARALLAYLEAHPDVGKRQLGELMGFHGSYASVWVSNKLALLALPDDVQQRLDAGELGEALALRQRRRLNDGRGHPKVISDPDDDGRSRSVNVEIRSKSIGRGQGARMGLVSIGVDHASRTVDIVVEEGDRRVFLTLSPEEAKLLGRRFTQAFEAVA